MDNLNEIDAGWDAYGNDGRKIGSVYERGETYLVVEKGVFFPKDIYVPTDAIERADPDEQRVYLSVAKNDVESMGWDEPAAGAEREDAGTMASQDTGTSASQDRMSSDSLRVPVRREEVGVQGATTRRDSGME